MRELLPMLIVIACPLMMVLMMRGGHGDRSVHRKEMPRERMSLDELKRHRDELNEEIAERAEHAAHSGYSAGAPR
jgi:Protein of unknown function (DUF2933)